MAKSIQQIVNKWQQNTIAGIPAYKAGVMAVTQAPGQAAANQVQAYIQGTQASAQKFATNVAAVSLSSWQQSATGKGAQNIGTGVNAATAKVTNFMTQLMQHVTNQQAQLNASTPKGAAGSAQNQQRMIAWSQAMRSFKKTA